MFFVTTAWLSWSLYWQRIVQDLLDGLRDRSLQIQSSELHIEQGAGKHHPTVAIRWYKGNHATQLALHPVSSGRGPEAGVVGYYGSYDVLKLDEKTRRMNVTQTVPLERLFGAPTNIRFAVKPTLTRWAVGKDEMSILLGSDNVWTLYVGMGFLFLGEPWMMIGFHEAGHVPENSDPNSMRGENDAWSVGKRKYASFHDGKQKGTGLFDLLQKPTFLQGIRVQADTNPTIGEIERYGITSHAIDPSVKLPFQWVGEDYSKAIATMQDFEKIIEKAQNAYKKLLYY